MIIQFSFNAFFDYNCNLLDLESMPVFLGYIDNGETRYDWSSERNNILFLHLAKNCTEKYFRLEDYFHTVDELPNSMRNAKQFSVNYNN